MPITITHQLNLNDARRPFPELGSLVEWRRETLGVDEAVSLVVPEREWPRELGVDAALLLLIVPDDLAHLLPALATASLDVYNSTSDDLLNCRTVLSLAAPQTELQVDGRLCRFHPEVATGRFYVAIAAADAFVLARHDVGPHALDGLQCAWQAACQGSGPNYQPYRLWSDEQLVAAARGARRAARTSSLPMGAMRPVTSCRGRLRCAGCAAMWCSLMTADASAISLVGQHEGGGVVRAPRNPGRSLRAATTRLATAAAAALRSG